MRTTFTMKLIKIISSKDLVMDEAVDCQLCLFTPGKEERLKKGERVYIARVSEAGLLKDVFLHSKCVDILNKCTLQKAA